MVLQSKKIGILGGGQLGRMLCQAASPLDLNIHILDSSKDFPAGSLANTFMEGDFKNKKNVLDFGKTVDLMTIEIEHVSTEALLELEAKGLPVHPRPAALNIIKDKGLQKQFYKENGIPTAPFILFKEEKSVKKAIEAGELSFPFVQKTRTAGYDGKGVAILKNSMDLETKLLKGACLIEPLVDFQTEIAVIAAKNPSGDVAVFPAVEMDFHPTANLVEFLICPARISTLVAAKAEALAEQVIRAFDICGLLAVEMFLTKSGELLVNEVAPRPHNSGHHTIDANVCSQYEQHLRGILDLPLGDTHQKVPVAIMLNLLGAEGHTGPVQYEGLEKCMALSGVHFHLYGKKTTKPFRKMGHVTITADTYEAAQEKADFVKKTVLVRTEVKEVKEDKKDYRGYRGYRGLQRITEVKEDYRG